MKSLLLLAIIGFGYAIHECDASAAEIVAAARTQIGVPYSWGGGNYKGKSIGIDSGAHTIGFDCSGLAQYSVYKGTGKIIARTAATQYLDAHCAKVAYASHVAGDLVFFGSPPHHVGIVSGPETMINAPQTGELVKEATIPVKEREPFVRRCA